MQFTHFFLLFVSVILCFLTNDISRKLKFAFAKMISQSVKELTPFIFSLFCSVQVGFFFFFSLLRFQFPYQFSLGFNSFILSFSFIIFFILFVRSYTYFLSVLRISFGSFCWNCLTRGFFFFFLISRAFSFFFFFLFFLPLFF